MKEAGPSPTSSHSISQSSMELKDPSLLTGMSRNDPRFKGYEGTSKGITRAGSAVKSPPIIEFGE